MRNIFVGIFVAVSAFAACGKAPVSQVQDAPVPYPTARPRVTPVAPPVVVAPTATPAPVVQEAALTVANLYGYAAESTSITTTTLYLNYSAEFEPADGFVITQVSLIAKGNKSGRKVFDRSYSPEGVNGFNAPMGNSTSLNCIFGPAPSDTQVEFSAEVELKAEAAPHATKVITIKADEIVEFPSIEMGRRARSCR